MCLDVIPSSCDRTAAAHLRRHRGHDGPSGRPRPRFPGHSAHLASPRTRISPRVDTAWSRRGCRATTRRRTEPISVGTYVRSILDVRGTYRGRRSRRPDRPRLGRERRVRSGCHRTRTAFRRFVALAAPPTGRWRGMFSYRQLKRSFYIWFIQQVGLAESGAAGARILGVTVGGLVAGLRRPRRRR